MGRKHRLRSNQPHNRAASDPPLSTRKELWSFVRDTKQSITTVALLKFIGLIVLLKLVHYIWLSSKLDKPSLIIRQVMRVPNMSVAEFETNYGSPHTAIPMVFTGITSDAFNATDWTREAIQKECGHMPLIHYSSDCPEESTPNPHQLEECHDVRYKDQSKAGSMLWAGMNVANLKELGIQTLGDLMELQKTPQGSHLYLHDAPFSRYCPSAMERLRVPKYFARDYKLIREQSSHYNPTKQHHWPSMFLSAKGTGSGLHVDMRPSSFWSQQVSGRKHWRLAPPSENDNLYVQQRPGKSPVYLSSILQPDFDRYPRLDGTVVYDAVLEPGDVLYVPSGWIHEVINLDDAMMIGQNFFELHNLHQAMPAYAYMLDEFFMPLPQPSAPAAQEEEFSNLPIEDFYKANTLSLLPVSDRVRRELRSAGPDVINRYRNRFGSPALHVAVVYNYGSLLETLLDYGADINLRDDRTGQTPLDVANEMNQREVRDILLRRGGKVSGDELLDDDTTDDTMAGKEGNDEL